VIRPGISRSGRVGPLERFVSHFTNRLDAKGRVSIPASFRAVLARDGFEGLYVHPSLDAEALDCGGNALLREIDGLLGTLSPYSEERDMFSTALLGTSEVLKIDPEGRVILTETLRTYAGISAEVTFVGQGHKFQIWEPERFRAHLDEARNRVRTMRKQLSSRPAAGTPSQPPGARE
jgi:MraZ protein